MFSQDRLLIQKEMVEEARLFLANWPRSSCGSSFSWLPRQQKKAMLVQRFASKFAHFQDRLRNTKLTSVPGRQQPFFLSPTQTCSSG